MSTLQPYPKYKAVDLLWLKKIPSHWEFRHLYQIASEYFVSNKNIKHQNLLSLSYGKIVKKDINTTEGLLPSSFDSYQVVKRGIIVIRLTDLQNDHRSLRVGLAKEEGIITSAYLAIKASAEVLPEFLYLLLHSYDLHKVFYGMGGGLRQSLKWDEFKKLDFYIPPRDEQEKIVAFLDEKTAKIDKLIAAKTKEMELIKEQQNAEISQAVTRGLNPNVKFKAVDLPWLKEIPSHWEFRHLYQIASEYFVSNKNIKHQNLLSLSYGKIVKKDINTTEGLLPSSFDSYQVVKRGIIVIRLTDLQNDHRSLRVGLAKEEGIITSAYLAIKASAEVLPEFLYLLLHSYDLHKVFYGMGGGLRQSLKWDEFKKLDFYIPPRDEQEKIVAFLDEKTAKYQKAISTILKKVDLLKEYKTRLISDAVIEKIKV